MNQSYFDGGIVEYVLYKIVGVIVSAITFGLCAPWAIVIIEKWRCEHTVIDGKRLVFVGSATNLFAQWIKWLFFTIITFGIYSFWLYIKTQQWIVKNTHFAN